MNIRLGCVITNHAGQEFKVIGYSVSLDDPRKRVYKSVEIDSGRADLFYYCDQYGNGWTCGVIERVDWQGGRNDGENIEPPVCQEEIAAVRKAVDELAVAIGIQAHRIPDKIPALLNNDCCIAKPLPGTMDMLVKMNNGSTNVAELAAKIKEQARKHD